MADRTGGYAMITNVYPSGIAETGLTDLVSDRDTSLILPFEVALDPGRYTVVWKRKSDNGKTYIETVPGTVHAYDSVSGTTEISYNGGDYSAEEVSP